MKIYINDEEVLCASNMTIKESLKNTSSVILNNVYPKSWETDKDYVSRYYMPKDYSHCKVIDENIETETEYDLSNNIYELKNRAVSNLNKLKYDNYYDMTYIRVIPNKTYTIKLTNNNSGSAGIWQIDDLTIGSTFSVIMNVASGVNTVEITPTKKYIIAYSRIIEQSVITFNTVKTKASDSLIFSGLIKNSGNINLNPRFPHYSTLQLLDYKTFLSEGETLNYVLESQTVSSAIKNIVKDLDGFFVGDIQIKDDTIAAYNCNEKTAFDVFEYLAEITGSIWFTKVINEKAVLINFYSTDSLEQKDNIEYTQEYFRENNIQDIKYSYNSKDYRNKQSIVSDKATANILQIEYITYNGTELKTAYPISSISSIKSGTKTYSVASSIAQNNGVYARFYYTYGQNSIEVNYSIPSGTVLEISYYPIVTSRQVAYNQSEIDRISETTNRNGTIARYEKRTDTTNETALAKIAQTYLDYKGVPEITVTLKTYYKDLFNIGDVVFFNGPLNDLRTKYLVIEKSIDMYTTGDQQKIFYTYKLSSSFNDENAINFFDNQRRKLSGNIEEGQYISRYVDLPSSTNIIFYDLSFATLAITNDILDGVLDIELIGNNENTLDAQLNFKL